MNNQDDNQQRKLPVPKHLTDREKANLMVAWARTHNKLDLEAGTITYPSGAVGKLKPKKQNKVEKQETSILSPEKIEKGDKLIASYINSGIYKFYDILEDIYAQKGDSLKDIFIELKVVYSIYYVRAEDNIAIQMDSNIRNITYEFFVNKFKMEEPKLTTTETLGRKHIMKFLESLILNFKSKGISSNSLMGVSKAYYLLDNYKKITFEGYLRLESNERDEEGDLRSYVFRIDSDESTLSYEGYTHGPYGGDPEYEEMFNFDYDYNIFDEPELKISSWIDEFENIFNNNGSLSIDDSTEDIEEIEQDDDDGDDDDDEQEEE